jgi:hypothetical protein
MPFAEFCCRSGGSNMNGGGLASGAEPGTSAAYTSTNGNWNGTATFTPTDGSTPASSVNVGDWASVYIDGATTPVYIARVTTVAAGANGVITLSTTAKSGTAPTSSATARTIKVGGAWLGPNGAVGFPFGFLVAQSMLSVAGNTPRVNFKNDQTYTISAAMTHSTQGPIVWQGYTTTFGDLGRAVINGGTTGVSYVLLTLGSVDMIVADFIFDHNGATGASAGATFGSLRNQVNRCVFRNMVGAGAGEGLYVECEAYGNNTANGAQGGFVSTGAVLWCINCISHDNAGSNSNGFYTQSVDFVMLNCIAAHNGKHGFDVNNITGHIILDSCDAYNNAQSGLRKEGGSSCPALIRNSNFVKNGAWGIDFSGSAAGIEGTLYNNGFGGVGTQQNGSGTINGGAVYEVGRVTYAANVTPWVDPANGDFRVNLAAAQGKGRGAFTSLMAGFSGTVAFPDIGAGQDDSSAGGGGGGGTGGVSRGRAMTGM